MQTWRLVLQSRRFFSRTLRFSTVRRFSMASPSIPDILARKRDGQELTEAEIQAFVNAVVNHGAQKEQIGAWLMAVFIRGLSERETIDLTAAMMRSGECLSWPTAWDGLVVDKHSTGGVGDKVSLVLAPALAACGMKVPMISGRGLEHTGGTLDKLEAIPEFDVSMTPERMHEVMNTVGCCIVGQTDTLVPADKILYATRDVTGTVAQNGLITGSIISKKAAEGVRCLVLDVKYGSGAFMTDPDRAEQLARTMVGVGSGLGIKTAAVLSSMENPLGRTVGHAVEVSEAVNCLKGQGPGDLQELVAQLGGLVLHLANQVPSREEGFERILGVINDGSALTKFREMIVAQGVRDEVAARLCDVDGDPWNVLPRAKNTIELRSSKAGFIHCIEAMPCARAAFMLGAGRQKAGDKIDLTIGLELLKTIGDEVNGDPWIRIHCSETAVPEEIVRMLQEALDIRAEPPGRRHLIRDTILPDAN